MNTVMAALKDRHRRGATLILKYSQPLGGWASWELVGGRWELGVAELGVCHGTISLIKGTYPDGQTGGSDAH